jgi:hypothetical protein
MKSPIVLLRSLLTDVSRLEPGAKGLQRDLLTLEFRFSNEGFSFFTVALPTLCNALDRGLATGRFTCPLGFKKIRKGALPKLFSGLLSDIFESDTGRLKQDSDNIGIIKCLREVLMLFKKTLVSSDREEILDRKACNEFIETDVNASAFYFEDRETHLFDRVCSLVLPGLRLRDLEEIDCKHGPGGVFEGVKGNQKWSTLVEDIKSDAFDVDKYGYSDFANLSRYDGKLPSVEAQGSNVIPVCFQKHASDRIARLVTVPKNSTSRRTITVEPLANQFIQQGLNTILREEILKCGIMRLSLALSDQSLNQKLALVGSRTDEWATIDLKAASDSLSLSLVELAFRRHGSFLRSMIDCRSRRVELPNKDVFLLLKFAGMGNALTFPVQSIVFALLAYTAILDADGTSPSVRRLKRAASLVRVYGDDIIVHRDYVHRVVVWLQRAGLKINTKKSFLEGNFKESCGVDAYKGVDVTPMYIKYRPDDTSPKPNAIANWVSISNQAWLRGLYTFSTTLKDIVEDRLKKRLPLVSQSSGVLGWHTRKDGNVPILTKWNKSLQRLEYKAFCLFPFKRGDKLDGYAALLKFFHRKMDDVSVSRPISIDPEHLERSPVRFQVKIAERWVPV